jgi:AraC-like DNA-binding protein
MERLNPTTNTNLPMNAAFAQQNSTPSWESLAFDCNFRIGKLAKTCQVSVRTLQRHFRKHYDLTLREWLREARLEKSRTMLPDAGCIKTVAYELGYKQPSHFTRDFKQRYGVPPKVWLLTDGSAEEISADFSERSSPRPELESERNDLFASC